MFHLMTLLSLSLAAAAIAFPAHQSLAGLTRDELNHVLPGLEYRNPEQPPGPLNDTLVKVVNDEGHPGQPLHGGDIRSVCPGLNTLASHGVITIHHDLLSSIFLMTLPCNGIATPAQIITAVQEGFNIGNDLAIFLTYAACLVDGNPITNLMSSWGKTHSTGNPPAPAIVGDTSMTRGDAFFGDNFSFNETLFQERFQCIQDSIATNPNFSFVSPRFFTAYDESFFPLVFFMDGRVSDMQLDVTTACSFFQNSHYPDSFFRDVNVDPIFTTHSFEPGANHGIGNYVPDPALAKLGQFCLLYTNFINNAMRALYPNAIGDMHTAKNTNLDFFLPSLRCVTVHRSSCWAVSHSPSIGSCQISPLFFQQSGPVHQIY
ncbi:Chloroperoxidase [Gautieria morchelliformis]|nr:Chloroperoxidase [Gautieria morchelliformis]